MTSDSRPVLLFDLDETVLHVNSFPVWAAAVLAARFPAMPAPARLRTAARAAGAIALRKLGRIDHAELKRRLAPLWLDGVAADPRQRAASALHERLLATVRPSLQPLLAEVREGRVDAVLTTAAAAAYAEPLGRRLGFAQVVASGSGDENLGVRKRDHTLERLRELGWHRRRRVLLTDHLDDLPLVREADLSLWFGGADSLAEARRQARGARIECGLSAAPPALRALALGTPA